MSVDIAYQVAQYLANAGFGTLGTDIFSGQIPSDQNGIYTYRAGGQLHNYTPIEETIVDIYIKSTVAKDAITTLEQIKRHTHRMHSTDIGESHVYSFLALGDIETLDRDLENAQIFKLSLQVIHRDTNLIS